MPLEHQINLSFDLLVNQGEAELVKRIYETYLSVGSVELTVRAINKAGFRNKFFKSKDGTTGGGQKFNDNSIARVLQNPIYLGKRPIEDEEGNITFTEAVWPAIVSQELADAVKAKMDSNRHWFKPEGFSEHPYLLSGVISCGECGGSLSGAMAHGRSGEIAYYQHSNSTKCSVKRVQAKRVESVILQRLRKIKENPDLAKEIAKGSSDSMQKRIPELESQAVSVENNVREYRKKAANLLNYLADVPAGADPKMILGQVQEFEEKAKQMEEERENLHRQIREVKSSVASPNQVTDHLKAFFKEFDTMNLNEKRDALGCVLSSIRVFPEKLEVGFWVGALASARSLGDVTLGHSNRHSLGRWFGKREDWRTHETINRCLSSTPYIIDVVGKLSKPLYKDKEFLHQKYVIEGWSLAQISRSICSSRQAVRNGLKRFGIRARLPHRHHGRPAQPKFGQKVRKDIYEAHHAEQRVIASVLELKASGMGLRQIARALTQLQIPTKCRGKAWHPEMIRRILDGSPLGIAPVSPPSDDAPSPAMAIVGVSSAVGRWDRGDEGPMTKSEFIDTIAKKANLQPKQADAAVNIVFSKMIEAMHNDERIEIRGFGSFTMRKYGAYQGRNPKTGLTVEVPGKRLPHFKTAKELSQMVDRKPS